MAHRKMLRQSKTNRSFLTLNCIYLGLFWELTILGLHDVLIILWFYTGFGFVFEFIRYVTEC